MDRVQGISFHVSSASHLGGRWLIQSLEKAKEKALALLSPKPPTTPAAFSEFGTRRRRSFEVQDLVLRGLIEGHEEVKKQGGKHGVLTGTSNVGFSLPTPLPPSSD